MKYLLVNACLVGVWPLGDRDNFWPKWVILFWGLGVAIKYFKTYYQTGIFSEEKEYEKLKREGNS